MLSVHTCQHTHCLPHVVLLCACVQVAADPNTLYPILIDSPAVGTLAGLLSHDNTDIAVEVMDLLQELTDAGEGQTQQQQQGQGQQHGHQQHQQGSGACVN